MSMFKNLVARIHSILINIAFGLVLCWGAILVLWDWAHALPGRVIRRIVAWLVTWPRIERWQTQLFALLERESTMELLDRVLTQRNILIAGVSLFVADRVTAGAVWAVVDPFIGLIAVPAALGGFYEYWRSNKRRFVAPDGDWALIALSVNTDMSRTVPEHFGRMPDQLINSAELCSGRKFLTIEDMDSLAKEVGRACAPFRHRIIKLVLSGPPALAAQIARYLPVDKYRVVFCYWDGKGYTELPPVDIQEYAEVSC